MSLASNYLEYADKISRFLKDPSIENRNIVEISAKKLECSFYGVTISPPKVLDGLERSLELLSIGDFNEWERLLNPLRNRIPGTVGDYSASDPVYYRLESIRDKIISEIPSFDPV